MQCHWTEDSEVGIRAWKAAGNWRGDSRKEEATQTWKCVKLHSNNWLTFKPYIYKVRLQGLQQKSTHWWLKVTCINLVSSQCWWDRVWISITANLEGFDEHFGLIIETPNNPTLKLETHNRTKRCTLGLGANS